MSEEKEKAWALWRPSLFRMQSVPFVSRFNPRPGCDRSDLLPERSIPASCEPSDGSCSTSARLTIAVDQEQHGLNAAPTASRALMRFALVVEHNSQASTATAGECPT